MSSAASTGFDTSLELDALQAILREHPLRLAILFGSHATGTTHTTRDIDLAVEFDEHRPSDPSYNDVFLGLSADLSDVLETDAVDLQDLHKVSPALAATIFEQANISKILGISQFIIALSVNSLPRRRFAVRIDSVTR